MWIIGLIGRGRRCARYLYYIGIIFFLSSCSHLLYQGYPSKIDRSIGSRVYDYVDEWPMYNNQPFAHGLMRAFNEHFVYSYVENEQYQGTIVFELIVNSRGNLVFVQPLIDKETRFSKEVESFLYSCEDWLPGRIHGKAVNTRIVWRLTL